MESAAAETMPLMEGIWKNQDCFKLHEPVVSLSDVWPMANRQVNKIVHHAVLKLMTFTSSSSHHIYILHSPYSCVYLCTS